MSLLFVLAAAVVAPLADPEMEARAQGLEREIRCVVCENEPISQSTAEIAQDMRATVRRRIEAGDTDAQVRAFFRDRYGEFVLLRPELSAQTLALWAGPFALLLAGFGVVWSVRRRAGAGTYEPEEDDR